MSTPIIRTERAGDEGAIESQVAAAFGRNAEARLVGLIRERGEIRISLVAEIDGRVVGHVLASPIRLTPPHDGRFLGIAPLSVDPGCQAMGIGSALMHAAIAAAREQNVDALFLLGRPAYYRRFGFVSSHIGNDYGATDAFMHLELRPRALDGVVGSAHYVGAFDESGT